MSTTDTPTETTTAVYKVYIKATPEAIWTAITDPEWTNRYGYTGFTHYDLRPGGTLEIVPNGEFKAAAAAQGYPCPDVLVDGEVIEVDPPRRLRTTWRMLMDPTLASEGFTKLTHEIEEIDGGVIKLTVIHELEGAPALAAMVAGEHEAQGAGGGWAFVLSDLKSLLESGAPLVAR